jgi:uncharacterized membrane protein YtjA (UPF0391 family)
MGKRSWFLRVSAPRCAGVLQPLTPGTGLPACRFDTHTWLTKKGYSGRDWQAEEGGHSSAMKRISGMLLIIAILLLLLWGGGFAFHVAGGLIHLLLVIALILFVVHLVSGRSSSV